MSSESTSAAVREQERLYGASIGASVTRIAEALTLSQAAVARTIGISPPMLSQLVHGQRIKLGSPLAVQRLQSLLDLVDDVREGLPHAEVAERLRVVAAEDSSTLTQRRRTAPQTAGGDSSGAAPAAPAATVRQVLRAAASEADLRDAAALLEQRHPALAEVLRAYGIDADEIDD